MAKFEIETVFTSTGGNEPEKLIGILNRLQKEAKGIKLDLFKAEDISAMKQAGNNLASVQNEIKAYINETVKMSAANKAVAGSYDEAQQQLTALGRQIRSAKDGFSSTSPALQSQIKQYTDLNDRLKKFDSTLGNFQRNVGNYNGVLKGSVGISTEFNRIIQDAPFGIIGVGNNIQQLTANYSQYAQQVRAAAAEQGKTVTTTALLKGALSGILSPINLLSLGISAVTSAWTLYTLWSQKADKANKEQEKSVQSLNDRLSKYRDTLSQVSDAQIQARGDAAEETTRLNTLRKIIEDDNVARGTRLQAIKDLKKEFPGYFTDLTNEQLLTGQSSENYKILTANILASAKARAFADKLGKNDLDRITLEQKISENQAKGVKNATQLASINSEMANMSETERANSNRTIKLEERKRDLLKEQTTLRAEQLQDLESLSNIIKSDTALTSSLESSTKRQLETTREEPKTAKTAKSLKSLSDIIKELNIDLAQTEVKFGLSFNEKRSQNIDDYQKAIDNLISNGYNKASEAVQKLIDKQNELQNALSARGGNLATPTTTPKLSTISDKEAKVVFRDVKIAGLFKPLSIDWTNQINGSIMNMSDSIISSLSNIGEKGSQTFIDLADGIVHSFDDLFKNQIAEQFKNLFTGVKVDFEGLGLALASVLGNIISGLGTPGKKGNVALKTVGGAISGGATGALIGTNPALIAATGGLSIAIGALGGALIGGLSGLFKGSKQQKEARIQEQQLAEQEKQTKLLERQNALAYASSIIGRQTVNGIVTGVEVNEFGQLTTKIAGQDLVVVIDRANRSRKRGT